jgi:phage shock protein PspC (stress-responsive transcriptional regulator)
MWLIILLVVLFALAIGAGGWGHLRGAYWGWSPAAVILAVVVLLFFTGNLHWRG